MKKTTVRDVDVGQRRVFVRVDFNVPLDKATHAVTDDTRIRAALPTIRYLVEHEARVILASHLGRPSGKVVEELRLRPVGERLAQLLGRPVQQADDCIGPSVEAAVERLAPGGVLLLENLRFHAQEEANDPAFAEALAALADLYVNDAFGTAHRAHASTVGITRYLPAVAGFLMEKELDTLSRLLENPQQPFAAIIGGAKVSTKIAVLRNLLARVNTLLVGGGMANTFLKAAGFAVGASLVEDDQLGTARALIEQARTAGVKLLLPVDVVVGDQFAAAAQARTVAVDSVPEGWRIMDIGPCTVGEYRQALASARTVIWNGPMGVFEFAPFAGGTRAIATTLAELNATTVVGGGESVQAVEEMGVADRLTHVSTGGGASLEFLEGQELPGVTALMDKR